MPELQGQGIAQKALTILESVFADARVWELETILQEKRNCHLYEKLGFRQTGECRVINDNMTIVGYEKRIAP